MVVKSNWGESLGYWTRRCESKTESTPEESYGIRNLTG